MSTQEYFTLLQSKYGRMLLSKSETANEIGISEATLDRLRKQNAIRSKKVGGKVFFTIANVADYIAA